MLNKADNESNNTPAAELTRMEQNSLKRKFINAVKLRLAPYPRVFAWVLRAYIFVIETSRRFGRNIGYLDLSSAVSGHTRQHLTGNKGLVQVTATEDGNMVMPLPAYEAQYEERQTFGMQTDIKLIAYYLPQFHAIPENDEWWGEGFTEWHNTRKAKPAFAGHYQPREPHDDIGYYDLSDVESIRKQVDLAKSYGIYGFCFYHYWFHGTRLLGKPVDLLLNNPDLDMPFCLCWANETWSRKWDGKDEQILIKQTFSAEDDLEFIEFLAPYFRDHRYIRVNGRAVLLVYRASKLPNPLKTTNRWRKWCWDNGLGKIHLVAVCHGEVFPHIPLEKIGFDAYAAFPPHSFPCQHLSEEHELFDGGYRFDYASGVDYFCPENNGTRIYEGCMLGWDNTARMGTRGVTMFQNFSVKTYYTWLRRIIEYTRNRFPEDERLVFINAWNEWAEGTYLEPDKRYGYVYLNTTAKALYDYPLSDPDESGENHDHDSAEKYTQEYKWLKYMIENTDDHSFSIINRFIDNDADVLEFGSAAGYFTRYLTEERNAAVDIVEIDSDCAAKAAVYARDSYIGDIEQYGWKDAFSEKRYDYILFSDVLEHLRDPWRTLKESVGMLKPGGRIILSVPNIAHTQILSSLYNNDFSYSDVGIMDRTHLRFFTEATLRELIDEAGLNAGEVVPVEAPVLPKNCGTRWNKIYVPARLWEALASKEHANAIQFVACCQKEDHDGDK